MIEEEFNKLIWKVASPKWDFDGAAADGKAYANKFSGKYSHKVLKDIGHNVPQEAPQAFADAIMEVSGK